MHFYTEAEACLLILAFHFSRKLLKMHETKYQPMEKADAEQIMEEILGMQCGLNPDQQVTCVTNWLLVAYSKLTLYV